MLSVIPDRVSFEFPVDDDDDDKEIRRDRERVHDGRSLRYHDNIADLRWHQQEQVMEDFDDDDF